MSAPSFLLRAVCYTLIVRKHCSVALHSLVQFSKRRGLQLPERPLQKMLPSKLQQRDFNMDSILAGMQKKSKGRDISVELYRVFLMFLICLIHSSGYGIAPNPYFTGGILWAVCGFVFISGWFGIRFSVSKMLRLLATGVFCGGLTALIAHFFLDLPVDCREIGHLMLRPWFLCAYMVLMLLVPFLNSAFDNFRRIKNGFVAFLFLLMWNWLSRTDIKFCLPIAYGLGDYTFMMMVVVYIAARFMRKCHDRGNFFLDQFSSKRLLVCVILLFALLSAGSHLQFGIYSSPFSLMMATMCFVLFKRLRVGKRIDSMISFISPSLLSVYLIHSNTPGFVAIKRLQSFLWGSGIPKFACVPLAAVIVFWACFSMDLLRRGACRLLRGAIKRFESGLDDVCARIEAVVCASLHK